MSSKMDLAKDSSSVLDRFIQLLPIWIPLAKKDQNKPDETQSKVDHEEVNVILSIQKLRYRLDHGLQSINSETFNDETNKREHLPELYIILDTNVLISDITLIEEIRTSCAAMSEENPILFIIPRVVLNELYLLKHGNYEKQLKLHATASVSYVRRHLARNNFQIITEGIKKKYVTKSNYDIIVECCLESKTKNNRNAIIFSNDSYLSGAATLNLVEVCSTKTIKVHLSKTFPTLKSNFTSKDPTVGEMCQTVYQCWSTTLLIMLEDIFVTEMKGLYGDEWQDSISDILPWSSLSDSLTSFKNHWNTVFTTVVDKQSTLSLNKLCVTLPTISNFPEIGKMEILLNVSEVFLLFFKSRPNYSNFKENFNKILDLKKKIKKFKSDEEGCVPSRSPDSVVSGLEAERFFFVDNQTSAAQETFEGYSRNDMAIVKSVFCRIWNFINYSCGMIIDSLGLEGDNPIDYTRPPILPPYNNTIVFVGQLYQEMINLKSCLESVLESPMTSSSYSTFLSKDGESGNSSHETKPDCFSSLRYGLECFAIEMELECESGDEFIEVITPEMLFTFTKNSRSRDLLKSGLDQLNRYIALIYEQISRLHRM